MEILISEYLEARSQLNFWKKREADLRIKLVNRLFPNATEGTYTYNDNNLKIKGKFGVNVNLNTKMFEEQSINMSEEELSCVTYKPTLSFPKFKNLSDTDKEYLALCVTISPAMPSVEITNEDITL